MCVFSRQLILSAVFCVLCFFRFPVKASLDMYGKILTAIEANNYDNFRKRAYISKTEKLLTLPFSYAKSLNPGSINKVRRDQTKSNQTEPNQTKPNQNEPKQTKPNQTKPN